MARKSRGTKRRRKKTGLSADDYRFPGESSVYWTGVGGMFILFVWIVAMFLMFQKKASGLPQWQWLYLFAWPIASIFLANYFSTKPRKAQLKKAGPPARVLASNHPNIHSALAQQSELMGMAKPPAMFIIEDDMAFIYSIPGGNGSIIASEPMLQVLNHDEFIALVAREVGFLAAHNVRVSLALTWIRTANPLLKIVLMPLVLMSALMRGWADLSELTGDRAAVLLTGQESMLNLALVKLIIAQDPQTDVDQEDLEAYLHGSSDIAADSKQLERHFRIGKFIENQPNLRERIEQVQEYRKSDQGKAAFAKLAEMRASSAA